MRDTPKVLTPAEAQKYYDRFGKKQDTQGFYENPALEDLITHGRFREAQKAFEFGCGTGKFAARLLAEHLPSTATYLGCDVSPVMVSLAAERLKRYAERAQLMRSEGPVRFPLTDHSVDHVLACYVLDLLSEENIRAFFGEAYRVLIPEGKLCLASLTQGVTPLSRIVSSLWKAVFRMRASLVGGCRPLRLSPYVDQGRWRVEHQRVLTPFGVPSEVLILSAMAAPIPGFKADPNDRTN